MTTLFASSHNFYFSIIFLKFGGKKRKMLIACLQLYPPKVALGRAHSESAFGYFLMTGWRPITSKRTESVMAHLLLARFAPQ